MKKKNDNTSRFQSKQIKINGGLNEDYKKVISFFVVLAIILGAVFLLYYFNGQYVTKDLKEKETTTTTAKFDKSVIVADDIFKQGNGEYMVLLYDKSSNIESILYSGLVGSYDNEKVDLYTVDLSSALNKKYYNKDGKENTTPTKASDLVITKTTLITIKKGKVTSYITDKDKIVDKLS